jgi:hypothetical protein
MGVEEIIWDCGYWAQGMTAFSPSRVCYDRRGRLRRRSTRRRPTATTCTSA